METRDFVNRLNQIARGYQHAQILFAGLRAGIFEHLETPCTPEEAAQRIGWSPRGTRMLLDGLVAIDLVLNRAGLYQNTPIASACLIPGSPADQTHILIHSANSYEVWGRLDAALCAGHAYNRERHNRPPEELRAFILGMADLTRHAAPEVLKAVDLSPYRKLLDVGTGPGAFSIAFLNAHPRLRATLFDLPPVIAIAREQVASAGLLERVEFTAGDITTDAFSTGHDVVFVSNIIHSFNSENNRALVRKCYGALQSGGLLIIKDFLVDTYRTGPAFSLVFALHMLVNTGEGDTYTCEEVASWTDAAGFKPGRFVDLGYASRLWLAEKP